MRRGTHVPDIQTAPRLAEVLEAPAPYLYAADNLLADWILAYEHASPAVRKRITRYIPNSSTVCVTRADSWLAKGATSYQD